MFKLVISQNVNGKEIEVTSFDVAERKVATDGFKGLKETCKIMSENHYTVLRLFKEKIELAKFSWNKGKNQCHSFNSSLIGKHEVY